MGVRMLQKIVGCLAGGRLVCKAEFSGRSPWMLEMETHKLEKEKEKSETHRMTQ